MMKLFKLASKKAIYDIVHRWINEGLLKIINNKLSPTSHFFSIPFVGIIKAGYPILADEQRQYYNLDEFLIDKPNTSMLLRVSGDSMIEAGIFDGDYVVIEREGSPVVGDIVLAEIDQEWTLKIYRRDRLRRSVYLEAANKKYPHFYPRSELKIHGVVKAVIRKFASIN
jgi:repressor LexA